MCTVGCLLMLATPSHVQVGTLTRRLGDMEADLAAAVATASQSAATLDQVKSMALQVRAGPWGLGRACVCISWEWSPPCRWSAGSCRLQWLWQLQVYRQVATP